MEKYKENKQYELPGGEIVLGSSLNKLAAYPDLLEACKMALHRTKGECYPDHPEVIQLEQAIAKAEGN